jgi:hypothetical protein
MNALVPVNPSNVEAYRASTDAADLCKEIVVATATEIQGRKYVCVEGWQAIAVAHGCAASAYGVERVEGGIRAIGQVRRMSDGAVIAEAEGFVGEDEATWFGGTTRAWKWGDKRGEKVWYDKDLPKRADYAIRAMAQTRAISRACRSAFAHVVVMMNANLSTTPAEEVPAGGFQEAEYTPVADATEQAKPQTINPEQELMLEDKMREAGVDKAKFLARAGAKLTKEVPAEKFARMMKVLNDAIAKAAPPENPQADPILEDEIPY